MITNFAETNHLRAGKQAGFRPLHWLEDLTVPADYCIDYAHQLCRPLALAFVDLEKAFDSIDHSSILNLLHSHYCISSDCIRAIQWLYTDVTGLVSGAHSSFWATRGVKQGCPYSPLLFGLFFNCIVDYITSQVPFYKTQHCLSTVFAACLAILVALYADNPMLIITSVC